MLLRMPTLGSLGDNAAILSQIQQLQAEMAREQAIVDQTAQRYNSLTVANYPDASPQQLNEMRRQVQQQNGEYQNLLAGTQRQLAVLQAQLGQQPVTVSQPAPIANQTTVIDLTPQGYVPPVQTAVSTSTPPAPITLTPINKTHDVQPLSVSVPDYVPVSSSVDSGGVVEVPGSSGAVSSEPVPATGVDNSGAEAQDSVKSLPWGLILTAALALWS